MSIDQTNYIELFLLYADNELTDNERIAVEKFASADPGLRKELDDILSTIQIPGKDALINKSFLLRREQGITINDENCVGKFIEYHDGELTAAGRTAVEKYVEKNESAAREFAMYGLTKLTPDEIIRYPLVSELLKHSGGVFYLKVLKISAAAIFAGLMIWWASVSLNQRHHEMAVTSVIDEEKVASVSDNTVKKSEPETDHENRPSLMAEEQNSSDKPFPDSVSFYHKNETSEEAGQKKMVSLFSEGRKSGVEDPNGNSNLSLTVSVATRQIKSSIPVTMVLPEIDGNSEMLPVTNTDADFLFLDNNEPGSSFVDNSQLTAENFVLNEEPDRGLSRTRVGILFKKVKRTVERANPINRLMNNE